MGSKKKTSGELFSGYSVQSEARRTWWVWVKARANALANDRDHTFTYTDRDAFNKNYTRAQIVQMYETAYSELAESFHGIVDRNEELEGDLAAALANESDNHNRLLSANNRIEKLDRRIEGFLTMIEANPVG